jgi:hypothetical protein
MTLMLTFTVLLLLAPQFWSAYAPCGSQDLNAVQITLEQIDVIKRFIQKYPKHLKLVSASHGKTDLQVALITIKNRTFCSFL